MAMPNDRSVAQPVRANQRARTPRYLLQISVMGFVGRFVLEPTASAFSAGSDPAPSRPSATGVVAIVALGWMASWLAAEAGRGKRPGCSTGCPGLDTVVLGRPGHAERGSARTPQTRRGSAPSFFVWLGQQHQRLANRGARPARPARLYLLSP